jgi:general secretion pathway protein N
MNELLRRNPLIAALVALCAVLAVVVVIELATIGRSSGTAVPRQVAAGEAKLLPSVAPVAPNQAYPETAARPLWVPTRRPAPPPAAQQASIARGQYILQGVTIAGATRIALLREKASGRIHRVEQGKDVGGMQVAEVEPEQVTLAQGAEREVLELRVQKPAAPGTPGAPPPATSAATGPFAPAPSSGTPQPGAAQPAARAPGTPGPMPTARPTGAAPAGATAPAVANPSPGAVPQQSNAPMTPEELLARRRARRNPSP